MTTKVLIDTDPGVDDALALALALRSPELEVVGVTTVFGNADVALTTRNAIGLLDLLGRPDIPVWVGAAAPLAGTYRCGVAHVHGRDAMGDGSALRIPGPPARRQLT